MRKVYWVISMKLEVGMFIRTPLGIDKIIYLRIQDEYGCNYDTQLEHNLFLNNEKDYISIDGECFEKEEIKASYNIIDLIEEGDYVNGKQVTKLMIKMRDEQGVFGLPDVWKMYIEKIEVESIVTKEQFESMSYKVKED